MESQDSDMTGLAPDLPLRSGSPYTIIEELPNMDDTNQSIKQLSISMKTMVKKIQDLRHLGIENSKLPLPKIVVVGDQSTGKSSLIEGISEIKVPRSAGCCTRCPLEINLSESDSAWSCRVLLMKRYMYLPKGRMPSSKNPLGPWVEQEYEELIFDTLTDKSLLPDVLKRAQLATLNPGRSPKDYMREENQEVDEDTQVKFSPNVVRLDITAPRFPSLSFYDLPGIINVAEIDDEKYLVTLIENLAKEYIQAENTIVLLTMPMTDDATNSSAARIVREVRGARERTLGVLTKPDRIDGGYEQWQELLSGEKFLLGHGYFVVKNNSDPMVEHAQAREEELMLFAHPPWATEFAEYIDRFGTRRLRAKLSSLLLKQIQDSLPHIVHQINQRAKNVDDQLAQLPDPPSANVPYLLCQKLNAFTNSVQAHMDGGQSSHPLLKQWGQLAADFQRYLASSRPSLTIAGNLEVNTPSTADGEEASDSNSTTPQKRKPSNGIETPTKRMKTVDPVPPPTFNPGTSTDCFKRFPVPARSFTMQDLRDINTDTYASGVPGLGNPQAVEILNRLSVAHWLEPMHAFLSETYAMLANVFMEEVETVFTQYRQTALYSALKAIILQYLDSIKADHYQQAIETYNIEYSKPFTIATTAFSKAQNEALQFLLHKRHALRIREYVKKMEELGQKCNPNNVTDTAIGPDRFLKEVEIGAASRAYYDIASSRFVDVICQGIYIKLFFRCRNELRGVIEEKLGILSDNASSRCMELMVEDDARQRRRVHLRREKEKLDKAQEWLKVAETESNAMDLFMDN